MYRIVTVPLQLVALVLMLVTAFGDIDFKRGDSKQRVAVVQIWAYLKALKTYKVDVGDFPTSVQGLQALYRNPGVGRWQGPYVDTPILIDPWRRPYVYRPQPGQEPEIVSLGSDGHPGPNNISKLTPALSADQFRSGHFLVLSVFLGSAVTFFGLFFLPRLLARRNA